MIDLTSTLTAIFARGETDVPLTIDEEQSCIAAAREGDNDAVVILLRAYAPAMRAAIAKFARFLPADEAAAIAVAALTEALYQDNPLGLRATLKVPLRDMLTDAARSANNTPYIPARTYKRYIGIMGRAEGDLDVALDLAPQYEMTRETFLTVHDAATGALGLLSHDDNLPAPIPDAATETDTRLVALAFAATTPEETAVIRHAYGFESYGDAMTDAEVGYHLDMTRSKAQRIRNRGLDKMRDALAVEVTDDYDLVA